MSEERKSLEQQIEPPQDEPLGIETEAHSGRDRSTSDAYFPPNPPPSSPHGAIAVPFSLPPPPFSEEGDTSFSRSIDAILATQTEREVAEEARKAAALSKRASNVLKLTQEKANLEKELRELEERLGAIERRGQPGASKGKPGAPAVGETSAPHDES